jgi:hypothetical protein
MDMRSWPVKTLAATKIKKRFGKCLEWAAEELHSNNEKKGEKEH